MICNGDGWRQDMQGKTWNCDCIRGVYRTFILERQNGTVSCTMGIGKWSAHTYNWVRKHEPKYYGWPKSHNYHGKYKHYVDWHGASRILDIEYPDLGE